MKHQSDNSSDLVVNKKVGIAVDVLWTVDDICVLLDIRI